MYRLQVSMSGYPAPEDAAVVSGKFLRVNGQRFLIKGVSYGTFAPNAAGALFPEAARIAQDFEAIAELEANTVRTYTAPPVPLLDEAARCGLRVIVGVPWMQHVAFLDRQSDARSIQRVVRDHVRQLAAHPASLMFALGNEIPPAVVRWYGRARIERFLKELYEEAKSAAPDAVLTYINYPPTEYLETPFFDVCAFNVFLHAEDDLRAYLARLHHVAGPRPLLISEVGADSLRHGDDRQAALVRMQVQTALREGACGAVVFSWTDDWWRGGRAVDDWAFGLVDVNRRPKAAYLQVQQVFRSAPFGDEWQTPRVSVVVCAYNAADTIGECLTALEALNYPDFEVIVVDDGSTDATAAIAARYPSVRLVTTPNCGLSAARNVGLAQATGEIVAYTDADVRVDPEWLGYLVQPFADPAVAAAGGPAVVPADDPWFAQCVARAPGSPTHVLLDDRVAEHVPGCNCAFRRDALAAIGGFNPIFVRAGDDVDACWRVQAQGWTIGFAPAALVWHRHRARIRAYWAQQIGYGEGETWLMREHPDKCVGGRITWNGHIYSPLPFIRSLRTTRVNAGPFGTAGFPSLYRSDAHPFAYLPHSGRWQVAWVLMTVAAAAAYAAHAPFAIPILVGAAATLVATMFKCLMYGFHSDVSRLPAIGTHSRSASILIYRLTIAWLHFVQPFARLWGRVRGAVNRPAAHAARPSGRRRAPDPTVAGIGHALRLCLHLPVEQTYWSQRWVDATDLLRSMADRLRQQRVVRHIELDTGWWEDRDLTIVDRTWFRVDVRSLVEDHGGGKCLHRFALRSRLTAAIGVPLLLGIAAAAALRYTGMPWLAALALVAAAGVIAAIAGILSTSRVVLEALEAAAAEFKITPITSSRRPRPSARSAASSTTTTGRELTTRGIEREAGATRALSDV
jgi:O-antigen biosynthesis protein